MGCAGSNFGDMPIDDRHTIYLGGEEGRYRYGGKIFAHKGVVSVVL